MDVKVVSSRKIDIYVNVLVQFPNGLEREVSVPLAEMEKAKAGKETAIKDAVRTYYNHHKSELEVKTDNYLSDVATTLTISEL